MPDGCALGNCFEHLAGHGRIEPCLEAGVDRRTVSRLRSEQTGQLLDLSSRHQLFEADVAAEQTAAINPNLMQGQIVLGDTLAALHRDHESAAAYNKALSIAHRMEPSAQAEWTARLNKKLAVLHL